MRGSSLSRITCQTLRTIHTSTAVNSTAKVHTSVWSAHSLQKFSSIALLGLIPAGALTPAELVYPIDLALGLVLPLHMQVGMRDVVRDYVPNEQFWQYVLLGVSLCTALGLARLNFNGDGISATAKRLWTQTKKKD